MTDSPHDGHDVRGTTPGIPLWVKISGLVVTALIVLLVAVMLIAGGDHGPGRHMSMASITGTWTNQSAAAATPPLFTKGWLG